jgi:MFS family permease
MFGFTLIWIGQIVSVLATNMSGFALTIWVFEKTQSAMSLGWMQVCFMAPLLIATPFAGVMVDRHNRKLMMMISDLAAGLATVAILVLQAIGMLEVWHLYIAAIFQGLGNAFQWPAYSAAISTMIPKEKLGRANGMMALVQMGPGVLAPMLAGALLPLMGLTGILLIDVVTFGFAVGMLSLVHIPQPVRSVEGAQAEGHILQEAIFGFRYIFARPSLLGLQSVFFFGNLMMGIAFTVVAPMILLRTNNSSVSLGIVQSAGAIGGVVGGVVMSAWGGFKRRVHGVLAGWFLCGLFFAFVGVGSWLPLWAGAMALSSFFGPILDGSNQALWQSKVAPDLQGRVFSARMLIAWMTNPISPIIAGALADYVLEPAARAGTGLPAMFSSVVGTGSGSGMGLLLVLCGSLAALAGLIGYSVPAIYHAETILPDHDAIAKAEPA